jgi:hypothetical protein
VARWFERIFGLNSPRTPLCCSRSPTVSRIADFDTSRVDDNAPEGDSGEQPLQRRVVSLTSFLIDFDEVVAGVAVDQLVVRVDSRQ